MSEVNAQYTFNIIPFLEVILYLEKFNSNSLQNTLYYSQFFDMFRPELLKIFRSQSLYYPTNAQRKIRRVT